MELHYDDVHRQRWLRRHAEEQKRMPERKGTHKVFTSVARAYRSNLNQSMRLPESVTNNLQCPEDEVSWEKLNKVREAICLVIQGECKVVLDSREDINELAEAIRTCNSKEFADEVGQGSRILPQGARVQIEVPPDIRASQRNENSLRIGFSVCKKALICAC